MATIINNLRKIAAILTIVIAALSISIPKLYADEPFRNHRYDALRVLPVDSTDVVFVGNSITNMHEWWEAFGSMHNVKNRGVSGAVTFETLANIRTVAKGKPKKMFLLIGTNDLGTEGINDAQMVADNIARIIDVVQRESPRTAIYVQSILPSNVGIRNTLIEEATNIILRHICDEKQVTYIDLWGNMQGIIDGTHSLDGLHLKASGYALWCNRIAPYVCDRPDARSIYPDSTLQQQNDGGLPGSYGMRCSQFSMFPVQPADILMIGDEMIHGGEWHELLQSPRIKNRGTGWGYCDAGIAMMQSEVDAIFNTHSGSCKPAAVFLYAGAAEMNSRRTLQEVVSDYQTLVNSIRDKAPEAHIYLMGLLPTVLPGTNITRVMPFNEALSTLAQEAQGVTYIDLYTPMAVDNQAIPPLFMGNYVSGLGYVKIANILAKYIGCEAISQEKALETLKKNLNF